MHDSHLLCSQSPTQCSVVSYFIVMRLQPHCTSISQDSHRRKLYTHACPHSKDFCPFPRPAAVERPLSLLLLRGVVSLDVFLMFPLAHRSLRQPLPPVQMIVDVIASPGPRVMRSLSLDSSNTESAPEVRLSMSTDSTFFHLGVDGSWIFASVVFL